MVRGAADAAGIDWKPAVYRKVEEEVKANRGLSSERMVELCRVSRSGFYRFENAEPKPDRDMDLRDAIQRIAVKWPSYGRPRITEELRRRGWQVNPKRARRCESLIKTLKYEEVLRNEYRDLAEARTFIREFLEKIYNHKRLHSALGYVPPAEFERSLHNNKEAAARRLSL